MKKEKKPPTPDLESVKESGQYRKVVLAAALAVLLLLAGLGVANLILCFSFGRGLFCPKQWSQKASNTNSSLGTSGVDQINTNNRSPATAAQNSAASMTNRDLPGAADTNYKFEWKIWSDWSGCSKPCGEDGIQTRRRECKKVSGSTEELAASDKCPDSVTDSETRNCISNPPCDKFEWKNWSDWSECSNPCGEGGTQTRKRECQKVSGSKPEPAASDKCDSAKDSESQKCKSDPPCEFKWSDWSLWCTNFQKTDQKRNRQCNKITSGTKTEVANPSDCKSSNSTGLTHEDTRKCHPICVADVLSWRDWSEWTSCDKPCKGGRTRRSRSCWLITGSSKEDKTENKNCEDCSGEKADESKQCNEHRPCRHIFT